MKPGCFVQRVLSVLMTSLLLLSAAAAQVKKGGLKNAADINRLSPNQQDALELLKTVARNLKSEPDQLAAAILQAQIADVLWQFDEAFARDVFRWSFDTVSQDVVIYKAPLTRSGTCPRGLIEAFGDRTEATFLVR